MVALFAVGSESWLGSEGWHSDYPHEIQYGLFPFWQTVDNGGVSGLRSSRILFAGLVETALAGFGIIFIVFVAWAKLIGGTPERDYPTDQFEKL